MSAPPSIHFKIDSGATHHSHEVGITILPQKPTYNYNPSAWFIVINVAYMVSSTTKHLPITSIPSSATKSHGFNQLAYGSLFSVIKSCNHDCTDFFYKQSVNIFKSTEVIINELCPPIIQGHLNAPSQHIYSVSLLAHPPSIHKENTTINILWIWDCIDFYRGASFSPKFLT